MNTTFEQHKVQLRKKQNKRAPTREHRRSKAMSVSALMMPPTYFNPIFNAHIKAFPNELDVINSMDI